MCKQIINSSANETELQLEQKWKNATIANNFIFYKVMQNNKDVCKELPERARYYQGVLDVQTLSSGANYKELKDNYVIFICVPDIFKRGLAKYTFENLCLENTEVKLNDRAYKYFFIAQNYDKILDERQKAFLSTLRGGSSLWNGKEKWLENFVKAKKKVNY